MPTVCDSQILFIMCKGKALLSNRLCSRYLYSNLAPWLSIKIANFSSFFCLLIHNRDLDIKKNTPNIEVCPVSLRAVLEYLTIIPRARVGYQMIDSEQGA